MNVSNINSSNSTPSNDPLLDSDPLDPLSSDNIQQDIADAQQAALLNLQQAEQEDVKEVKKRTGAARRVAEANAPQIQFVQPTDPSGSSGSTGTTKG